MDGFCDDVTGACSHHSIAHTILLLGIDRWDVRSQVVAMWVLDRERPALDELVNLLREGWQLPAVATGLYAQLVSKHMDLLCFRHATPQLPHPLTAGSFYQTKPGCPICCSTLLLSLIFENATLQHEIQHSLPHQ